MSDIINLRKTFTTLKGFEFNDQSNSDRYTFKGYLSTFGNIDSYGDVIIKGAFSKSIAETPEVPLLLNHKNSTDSIAGKIKLLAEDDYGLPIEAWILKTPSIEAELAPKIKAGLITSLSIGMQVIKYIENSNGYWGIDIHEAKVFEGSIVGIPANDLAQFDSFKTYKNLEGITNIRDYEAYLVKELGFNAKFAKTLIAKCKDFTRDVQNDTGQQSIKQLKQFNNQLEEILQ